MCPTQKISPCDCQFKARGELMAACPHWGNTGHISEAAPEAPSHVLIFIAFTKLSSVCLEDLGEENVYISQKKCDDQINKDVRKYIT